MTAVVSAALLVAVSAHIPSGSGHRALDGPGYALLVLAGLAMGACRRWPRLATVAVTIVLCVFIARDYPNGPVWLSGWAALAVLAWRTDRRTAVTGALAMIAALTVTAATTAADGSGVLLWAVYLGWSAAAVLLGEAISSRRSYLAGLAERARFAQRSREDEMARRVAEERLRIARDLHDSVAHAMAMINVQAAAAAHVVARRPEAAGTALTVIQQASAEVLEELGSMLSVLREDTEQVELAPAPGVADIRRLADSARPSGLTVDLCLDEPEPEVPSVLGTAAYRVVQESLTNVLRHSQACTVRVRVGAEPDGAPAGRGQRSRAGPGGRNGRHRSGPARDARTGRRHRRPAGGLAHLAGWVRRAGGVEPGPGDPGPAG